MKPDKRSLSVLLMIALTCPFVGCGDNGGLQLAPVVGTVVYQGKPLTKGNVVFKPKAGTVGPMSVGVINPDGRFVMATGKFEGVVVGEHTVTVESRRDLTEQEIKDRVLIVPDSLIPEKYSRAHETPLSYQVEDVGENVYEILLE